jgi:hypothetical protein
MKLSWKTIAKIGLPVALCLLFSLALAQDRGAAQSGPGAGLGAGAGQQRRIGMDPVDHRVQPREHRFNDTDETLPYSVFVSTKVTKDKKAPLVLALHGFSGNHGTFMRTQCVDEKVITNSAPWRARVSPLKRASTPDPAVLPPRR